MLNRACAPASLARKRLDLFMKRTKRSSMDGVEKRLNCKVSAREINEQLKGGGRGEERRERGPPLLGGVVETHSPPLATRYD